jgi:hypothetical protein
MPERRFPPPWTVEASGIIALSQRIMELDAGNGIVGVRLSEFVTTRLASRASTSGRGLLTFIQCFELSFSVRASSSQPAHPRLGAADRGQHCEAAGVAAEAIGRW